MYNLLTNAIKFTRQGPIFVRAFVHPRKKLLEVRVIDKGIGMSQDEASVVFDGFHKTNNSESKLLNPYSNGLGLSICKQICRSLGGEISVESTLGKGSTFTFTMNVFDIKRDRI